VEPDAAARIADLLSRTQRRLRRQVRRELGPLGVTPARLRALWALSDGALRVSDLAERLDVVPRSATSVVDDLEAAGFVERRPDPEDRRATFVDLTDEGAGLLRRLRASRRAGVAELLDRLSPDEQSDLIRLLAVLAGD